jgi:predicted nucleic acid-binding protein
MRILLDTNLLVQLSHVSSAGHHDAVAAIERLERNLHEGVIVPQVLYEYWVVVTRPKTANGFGASVAEASRALGKWKLMFRLLRDERGIFTKWEDLVATNGVSGKSAHDARLVAAMQRHGLTNLLTFNQADFARYSSITVYTPAEVAAGRLPT